MDPLVAAGLVGNIINFADFSAKVISRARQLHESVSGATVENDELESLTKNLKDLADRTRHKFSEMEQKDRFRLNITSETVLNNLSQQCAHVADELLEALDSIKVRSDHRTGKSAMQAMKTAWKKDHIDSLQRRLERISNQLINGMGIEQLEEINRRLREMAVENTRLEANRSQEINQLRQDFNSAIEEIKENLEGESMPRAWLVLSDTARRGQSYFAEQVILQSLRFSSINSRHQAISQEHSKTFLWIFDETSPVNFVEWLKEEDGVYWISGKPGSGKSTLMKFVVEHEETQRYLAEWAGNKKLIITNFYFWNASTHTSLKSQKGLLRTILYEILRQCPELIQVAYEDQWIAMTADGKVLKDTRNELLTVPALLSTIRKLSTYTTSDTKFCFFIDGLDEYDGRPADIIELIDILNSFQNAKACVSSRPWNEFEDRFGNDSPWKLYIHNFTRDDIRLYVEDTLGKDPRFQQLQKEDPECPNFVRNVVREADGVFLWVFLVTRSLLDGLTNSDRIKDLQDRVNETPKDLENYFKTILFSTENRYRAQTARILIVALDAKDELPLMAYWVIDQENSKTVFQFPVETISQELLNSRLENMKRRLIVLSKGLLQVKLENYHTIGDRLFDSPVTFLHRTVKDYLQTPDARLMLQRWLADSFDVDWEICSALVALAKMVPRKEVIPRTLIWKQSFDFFFVYARRVDQNPLLRTDIALLLKHLQTVLGPAFEENKERIVNDEPVMLANGFYPEIVIISACSCFGVQNFVAEEFAKDPHLLNRVRNHVDPLLFSTVFDIVSDNSGNPMLELLFANGADANRKDLEDKSAWRHFVESLAGDDPIEIPKPKIFEVCKLMLRNGADFEQLCSGEHGTEVKANELLREIFDADQFGVLEDIVKRRAAKTKKNQKLSTKMRGLKLWLKSKK